jgi:hypothetical protein
MKLYSMKINALLLRRALPAVVVVLAFCFCPLHVHGQYALTLNDEDEYQTYSSYIPFYGAEVGGLSVNSQFIIPSSDLGCVQNGTIQSITFYLADADAYDAGVAVPDWEQMGLWFNVYFLEVDAPVFEFDGNGLYSLYDEGSMTWAGGCTPTITAQDHGCMVTFSDLYYSYAGGHLLVCVMPPQFNNAFDCQWIGSSYNEYNDPCAAYSQYQDWMEGYSTYGEHFKPMMTIEYFGGTEPPCQKPTACSVESVSAHSAWVDWTPGGNETQWEVAYSTDPYAGEEDLTFFLVDTHPVELTGLYSMTEYGVWVRAKCADGTVSAARSASFWTDVIAAPTDLAATNTETGDASSADLQWQYDGTDVNPPYWDIALTMDWDASPDDLESITVNNTAGTGTAFSHHLTGLEPFTRYKAWVRADYGNGDVGTWSEPCFFRPTGLGYDELDVNNCTNTSTVIPFAQNWTGSRSQFIIPASALTELVGKKIWRLYFGYNAGYLNANNIDVYLAEIEADEFTEAAYYDWDDLERVTYQGSVNTSDGHVDFDHPYVYGGGNLLIGVVSRYCGYHVSHRWYGCTMDHYASLRSSGTGSPTLDHFVPHTRFCYLSGSDAPMVTDTTVVACDAFEWHGHTYQMTGTYYDTLTSVSGVDSIVVLHLTINHDLPIGSFTYLSPMDNVVIHAEGVDFVWDPVANAQRYDLYCWNGEGERPSVPTIPGIQATTCHWNGLANNTTYRWCVVARNDCYEVESAERTLVSQITPGLRVVPQGMLDFADVEIGNSKTKTLSIVGVALDESIQYGFLNDAYGADAPFFQIVPSNNWDALKGGTLSVTFTPSSSQLYYSSAIWIASGSLADTVYFEGAVANRYVFSTSVEQTIYTCDDEIVVAGHVGDVLGHAVENLDVEVYVLVMGSRKTFPTRSDEQGNYSVVYHPRKTEAGSYFVGSGVLGAQSSAVHDAFDIPGMGLVDNRFVIWKPYLNDTIQGTIGIRNRSSRPLSNIRVVPVSVPDGCEVSFSSVSLGSLESGYLQYVVTGTELTTGSQYEDAVFKIVSDEGVNMDLTCFYYCRAGRGVLDVYPPRLHATVDRTSQKVFSFQVTNNGNNETGVITIDVPDLEWMSVLGGNSLESLAVGDSCAFSIAVSPDSDMELTSFGGTIAVNCANGNGVAVPFDIVIAESSTGTLVVDVTDDYTYNTNGGLGPHLANAQVLLTGVYSLDTVAVGLTDTEGLFVAENVPEGYYKLRVSAPDHKDFDHRVIYVEADGAKKETNREEVYLQFQAISYSWVVVPTEIEDVYDFELVCDIKTNVPVPVVVIEGPSTFDSLSYGDTLQFSLSVSNYGLVDAYDAVLTLPIINDYVFIPLLDHIDTLHAKSSVEIPCVVTRVQGFSKQESETCYIGFAKALTWYHCNMEHRWVKHTFQMKISIPWFNCGKPDDPDDPNEDNDDVVLVPPDVPRPIRPGDDFDPDDLIPSVYAESTPLVTSSVDCLPCWKVALSTVAHLVLDLPFGPAGNVVSATVDFAIFGEENIHYYTDLAGNVQQSPSTLLTTVGNHAVATVQVVSVATKKTASLEKFFGPLSTLFTILSEFKECISFVDPNRGAGDVGEAIEKMEIASDYIRAMENEFTMLFQEPEWMEEENLPEFMTCLMAFLDTVNGVFPPETVSSLDGMCELTDVTGEVIQSFVDRWNRSVQYWSEGFFSVEDLPDGYNTDFIVLDSSSILPAYQAIDACHAYGYDNVFELLDDALATLSDAAREHTNDVCAKVSVSFKQTMAMTREAFEGTLKIYNGHASDPMENISLDLVIKDENGVDCTDLFQVNVCSLHQITGVDGTGTVQAQQEGVVRLVMIPTPAAAPTTPKVYSFGGSFSFLDPFSGEEMTYPLYPVALTVNPSPELHVDYFIQRHIISDDPLTEDTIEAVEPAELAMMVRNVGMGTANNVYLESSQPEIIDNQNGLPIQFDMVGSAMNGVQRPLGLIDIPFGKLLPQTAGIAEWYFTSTLMARVLRSTPHFIHNNSYGNPDLSLVTEVHSHELIKAVRAYGSLEDGINDFLVNETADFDHIPDLLYFSHGGTAPVKRTLDVTAEGTLTPNQRSVQLHLNPTETGWNYGSVDDPALGRYAIVRCVRDDGQEIPIGNVWITHVTMFDDDAPIHENKLHIVDTLSERRMTHYNVEYAPDTTGQTGFEQQVSLSPGWNWWSSSLEMDATLDAALKAAIAAENTTAVIKNVSGNTMLENGTWSPVMELTNESMYMIRVDNAVTAMLTGTPVDPTNHPITLASGWNWIGFPTVNAMTLDEAFAGITPNEEDVVKGTAGPATYTAEYGWNGSLTGLEPGVGYMYKNNGEPMTLTYPSTVKDKLTLSGVAIRAAYVYNVMGQRVLAKDNHGAESVELNLKPLASGVYTVSVHMADGTVVNRLVMKE